MIPFKVKQAFFLVLTRKNESLEVLVEFQAFKKNDFLGLGCVVLAIEKQKVGRQETVARFWPASRELTFEESEQWGAVLLGEALEKVGVLMAGFVRVHDISFYA